jgi:alanyl-tRNA synthetase
LEKLQIVLDEHRALESQVKAFRKAQLKQLLEKCLMHKQQVGGVDLIAEQVEVLPEDLAEFATDLIRQMKSGVVALGSVVGEKCQLLVAVSQDLVQKNIHAQNLVKEAAPLIQGGGGGRQNLAQAGGKSPQGLPQALQKIRQILEHVAR